MGHSISANDLDTGTKCSLYASNDIFHNISA